MSKPKKKRKAPDIVLEYRYEPTPESERRYAEAMDIITDLIIQDYESEQTDKPKTKEGSEQEPARALSLCGDRGEAWDCIASDLSHY